METQSIEAPAGDIESRLSNAVFGDEESEQTEEPEDLTPEEERTEEDESEEPDEGESEEEESTDSVEVDGKLIDLPPGTPAEVVEQVQAVIAAKEQAMRADYTRKTQEAADMRKFAETQYQEVQKIAQFNQAHISELAQLHSLQAQLQQYDGVDWNSLADNDPVSFMKHQHQRTELREAVSQMQNGLSGEFTKTQESERQRAAEVYDYTVNTLRDKIPNYGPEVDQKLVNAAVEMGNRYGLKVNVENLSSMHDPLIWLGLHEVARLQELVAKGAKEKSVPHKAQKFVQPGIRTNKTTESERRARDNLRNTGKGAASLIEKFI